MRKLKRRSRRREEEERGVTENDQNVKICREKERNTHQIVKNAKIGEGQEKRGEEERRRVGTGGEKRGVTKKGQKAKIYRKKKKKLTK